MVSVIVPVYNAENTLDKCVECLLGQTYTNLQILLVDDGCKDKSPAMCDAYAKRDARVEAYHQQNTGVSGARNHGLSKARGDYVWFVDADDFIDLDAVEKMVAAAERYSADMVTCGMRCLYMDTQHERIITFSEPEMSYNDVGIGRIILEMDSYPLLLNSASNKIYRLKSIQDASIRFQKLNSPGEDQLFNLDFLFTTSRVALLAAPLYHYIQYKTDSLVKQYHASMYESVQMLNARRRELYAYWDMDIQEEQVCCARACFRQDLQCVTNVYRQRPTVKRAQRLALWEKMLHNQVLLDGVRQCGQYGLEVRLIRLALGTKSASAADFLFIIIMWMRRMFGGVYNLFRDRFLIASK